MPDAGMLATVLLLVGLFLLGLEFFIPSFGMILTVAVISLVVSLWSAYKAWWGVQPFFFWTYILMLTAGIPGSLMGAIAIIQKTSLGNRMILNPAPVSATPAPNPLDAMLGKRGLSQTLMTPGGIVTIDSERFHAESLGMLIEPHTPVIVIGAKANRIVVRPVTAADGEPRTSSIATPSEPTIPERSEPEVPDPFDLSVPEDYTGRS